MSSVTRCFGHIKPISIDTHCLDCGTVYQLEQKIENARHQIDVIEAKVQNLFKKTIQPFILIHAQFAVYLHKHRTSINLYPMFLIASTY